MIQPECLKRGLKPVQQMKSQENKGGNIENHHPTDFKLPDHQ